jgi:hypothetical protein
VAPETRWRTPIAIAVTLAGLTAYVFVAATLSGWVPDHWAAELLFYLVAGIAWVYPAGRLIAWAGRDRVTEGTYAARRDG